MAFNRWAGIGPWVEVGPSATRGQALPNYASPLAIGADSGRGLGTRCRVWRRGPRRRYLTGSTETSNRDVATRFAIRLLGRGGSTPKFARQRKRGQLRPLLAIRTVGGRRFRAMRLPLLRGFGAGDGCVSNCGGFASVSGFAISLRALGL